jgi:nickel/cobalt transporter (NiCoT) family protein
MIQISISFLRELFSGGLRNRVIGFYGFLGCFNAGAAFLAFHDKPVLLGTAFLAYTFGLLLII